jgi:ribosomal protein L37AE/L43A
MTADRLELTEAERLAFIERHRRTPPTADELTARDARPWQRCPDCGREEAAHWYCSACYLPMGAADWVPTVQSEAALHSRRLATEARVAHRAARAAGDALGTENRPRLGRDNPAPAVFTTA